MELSYNQLSGSIPPELGNLSGLIILDIGGNQLSGSIPLELGNLTRLNVLWLQDNQLSGDVPSALANLTNLLDPGQFNGNDGLDLDYNHLNVPPGYPDPDNPLHLFLNQKDPIGSSTVTPL